MAIHFPEHPFFEAAIFERRIRLGTVIGLRRFAGAFVLLPFSGYLLGADLRWVGVSAIALSGYILCFLWARFLDSNYRRRALEHLPEDPAALDRIDFGARGLFLLDFRAVQALIPLQSGDEPNIRNVLRSLLDSDLGNFFIARTGIDRVLFGSSIENILAKAPVGFSFQSFLRDAAKLAVRHRHHAITPADLFGVLVGQGAPFAEALISHGIDQDDFDHLLHWESFAETHRRAPSFLDRLLESPGIGKDWAYGFTPYLDSISQPLEGAPDEELHVLAHREEIARLEDALLRSTAASVLVVGEPGIGKMTLVKGFADRVRRGKSYSVLNYKRVLELRMQELLAEAGISGAPSVLEKAFAEVAHGGNVILVIRDIDVYLAPDSRTRIAEALLPFLRAPGVRVIGETTPDGYSRALAGNPALASLFSVVELREPEKPRMMSILADVALALERRHGIRISYPALKAVYTLAERYVRTTPFPGKGVTLLEETFLAAKSSGVRGMIGAEVPERILEQKFRAPIAGIEKGEQQLLLRLEKRIHERVVNQEAAVRAIADAIRRKRAGVASGTKPAGTFLFLGPTGVGKTETARALAEVYFGPHYHGGERMVRFDMSEYQSANAVERLIGFRATNEVGSLTEAAKRSPFSLFLFDEIEKAHPSILNLFLQVLDEGRLTDAYGKVVDFKNAFIVFTSNAGSELIRERLASGVGYDAVKQELVDAILKMGTFRPELINRFDGVIAFSPLSREHVKKITELLLGKLKERLLKEGYRLQWDQSLVDWLAEHGYSEVFGARELRRLIQEWVESKIAKDIIAGVYQKGDTIIAQIPLISEEN